MGLTVKASGGSSTFKSVPAGMHLARCYRIIDKGTQITNYKGKVGASQKVMIQFEVHGEDAEGNPLVTDKNEPMTISKNFTASLAPASILRKELENWRSTAFTEEELAGFKLKNILGAWAMLSIVKEPGSDGNDYTNISSINPVSSQIRKAGLPTPHNPLKVFDLDDPDMELFETFGIKTKEVIQASPEWNQKKKSAPKKEEPSSGFDDMTNDIPF